MNILSLKCHITIDFNSYFILIINKTWYMENIIANLLWKQNKMILYIHLNLSVQQQIMHNL